MQLKLRNTVATLAAAVAITAALLGGMRPTTADASVAQPAHSASATTPAKKKGTVTLKDLECLTSEDSSVFGNGDELYIRAGGRVIWTAQDSVESGEKLAVNRKVKVGATVALYDDDSPDGDDLIGTDIVEGTRGTLVFGNDDARYTLDYS
jgi:hypothetical protein